MKREEFEWIYSWCDHADKNDLPRILLIGDSITNNYQGFVRQKLEGICYVDYVSTAYSIDNPLYTLLIVNFVKNSKYDLIQFNYGLHGYHIGDKSNEKRVRKVIDKIAPLTKTFTIGNITCVNKPGNKKPHPGWMKKIASRNATFEQIAKENGYPVNDLFTVSLNVPVENRYEDGIHYLSDGYEVLADKVVEFVKQNLK